MFDGVRRFPCCLFLIGNSETLPSVPFLRDAIVPGVCKLGKECKVLLSTSSKVASKSFASLKSPLIKVLKYLDCAAARDEWTVNSRFLGPTTNLNGFEDRMLRDCVSTYVIDDVIRFRSGD